MTRARTINYIAFPVLLMASVLGLYWIWGMVFLWWIVPSMQSGRVFLVAEIERAEDPILFWLVALLWAVFGVSMIAVSIFPQFATWLV